ncbi:helix-turn-helix domain-containing protein [uncultured Pseudacidovorax sp.]|uniref:HVO_A0114 family putative DNA-binding protein n=1 Tax=uncultured Pseudacidovorax sp. TaxID=679313 RepID=UPI0025FD939F|nr:helix-turn-helix domain-containing protein [uncultured Pseudacidovorax sp.]
MNTVTIEVADRHTSEAQFLQAMTTGRPVGAYITFPNMQALWATLTAERWDIVRAMWSAGPLTLREVARRVDRDVKGVLTDVHALLDAGVLEKAEDGRIVFPYDAVHVDFMMQAAALS